MEATPQTETAQVVSPDLDSELNTPEAIAVGVNLSFIDLAVPVWEDLAPNNGEKFKELQTSLHTAWEEVKKAKDGHTELYVTLMLGLTRDLADAIMGSLFCHVHCDKLSQDQKVLVTSYYQIMPKEEVVKKTAWLREKLSKVEEEYKKIGERQKEVAAALLTNSNKYRKVVAKGKDLLDFRKAFQKLNSVAQGYAASFAEVDQKVAESRAKSTGLEED